MTRRGIPSSLLQNWSDDTTGRGTPLLAVLETAQNPAFQPVWSFGVLLLVTWQCGSPALVAPVGGVGPPWLTLCVWCGSVDHQGWLHLWVDFMCLLTQWWSTRWGWVAQVDITTMWQECGKEWLEKDSNSLLVCKIRIKNCGHTLSAHPLVVATP